MAQWVKALALESDRLSSIPRSYMMESSLLFFSLALPNVSEVYNSSFLLFIHSKHVHTPGTTLSLVL